MFGQLNCSADLSGCAQDARSKDTFIMYLALFIFFIDKKTTGEPAQPFGGPSKKPRIINRCADSVTPLKHYNSALPPWSIWNSYQRLREKFQSIDYKNNFGETRNGSTVWRGSNCQTIKRGNSLRFCSGNVFTGGWTSDRRCCLNEAQRNECRIARWRNAMEPWPLKK